MIEKRDRNRNERDEMRRNLLTQVLSINERDN
jgi:hypothetical protein